MPAKNGFRAKTAIRAGSPTINYYQFDINGTVACIPLNQGQANAAQRLGIELIPCTPS